MDNLYDYRDDPFDGCDMVGNPGCPGVAPPFDYPPASDAEYQARETKIAHQIVDAAPTNWPRSPASLPPTHKKSAGAQLSPGASP